MRRMTRQAFGLTDNARHLMSFHEIQGTRVYNVED